MSVRIRMKKMGRSHQPFFRICAIDKRSPRHGRVLEELGTYNPLVKETDARALLKPERIDYWLGVGAAVGEGRGADQEVRHERHPPRSTKSRPRTVGSAPRHSRCGAPASMPKSKDAKEAAPDQAASEAAPEPVAVAAGVEATGGEAAEETSGNE